MIPSQLTKAQREILIHAMVRLHVFHKWEDPLGYCAGIGTPSAMRCVVSKGYMRPDYPETKGVINWYKLTPKGVAILEKWKELGAFVNKDGEAVNVPEAYTSRAKTLLSTALNALNKEK